MERSLYRFILRYSRSEQLAIVPLVVASMLLYFATLDLPKTIINEAIQGRRFSGPEATVPFLALSFELPAFLGGGTLRVFDGIPLAQVPYLVALTLAFLALIVVGGLLKYQINTLKGWMGERMLRRLRYALIDRILRFPLARFRRVKSAELASMIKDEVEPLGGFIGEALVTPLFLGGQALTALFFIMVQHLYLGSIALAVVLVQAFVIPRLRRRILALSKERQLAARALAGRIAEVADGAVEIHANDTSNYERAEISARLARIFRIRFEIYQRKFMVKFLNNFLSQLAPFFFYLVGGYLVIVGRLDIGTLVAVIAAYKDLPSPVKELIDWDQQRLDVQLKYTQVIEQFMGEDLMPKERQKPLAAPPLPESGTIRVANLTLAGEAGVKILENVSFEVGLEQHVAIVGGQGSGASELALALARLVPPTAGSIEIGGVDIVNAPEAVTGRALGYVGPSAYLFPTTVRENLVYALKHHPVREAVYEGEAAAERAFQLREAKRTGSTLLDINADWVDYAAAGVSGPEALEARLVEVLRVVDLEETIFELGLRTAVDPARRPQLVEGALAARAAIRDRMAAPGIQALVEHFDPERFNRNATLAENLLFGTPVGRAFDIENLAKNAYVRRVLAETGLEPELLATGHKLAETMVELFSGLPPGHEFFERFSFIRHEELPEYKALLARVAESGLASLDEAERERLLALPFRLVPARHRLGLVDEALEARILRARRYFREHLPSELAGAVEFFDPARYNGAASIQDNILFGKVVSGQADAATRVGALLRAVLEEHGLRLEVVRVGLDFHVGVGGARLSAAERQKLAVGRMLLKRPAVAILDGALGNLDPASQNRVLANVLEYRKGRSVLWVLARHDLAARFDCVLVMERGRLAEKGRFEELKSLGGALERLLAAA